MRQVAQVRVAPGGLHAAIDARALAYPVPAQAEAVAVGRLRAETRVQALVDEPVLGLEEQLVDQHRLPMPRHPSTHAPTLTAGSAPRLILFGRCMTPPRRTRSAGGRGRRERRIPARRPC